MIVDVLQEEENFNVNVFHEGGKVFLTFWRGTVCCCELSRKWFTGPKRKYCCFLKRRLDVGDEWWKSSGKKSSVDARSFDMFIDFVDFVVNRRHFSKRIGYNNSSTCTHMASFIAYPWWFSTNKSIEKHIRSTKWVVLLFDGEMHRVRKKLAETTCRVSSTSRLYKCTMEKILSSEYEKKKTYCSYMDTRHREPGVSQHIISFKNNSIIYI